MVTAQDLIQFIDLTSLSDTDTDTSIATLCQAANTAIGAVASVCAYQQFVPVMRQYLANTPVKVCTVSNFPEGGDDVNATCADIRQSAQAGADEIDVVLPYTRFLAGDTAFAADFLKQCRTACGDKLLKVIIETSALETADNVQKASELAIDAGALFIKTSTGKHTHGATLEHAAVMLKVIRDKKVDVGFKASGGIREVSQGLSYLQLAIDIMGESWPTSSNFRLGTSALLADVMAETAALNTE